MDKKKLQVILKFKMDVYVLPIKMGIYAIFLLRQDVALHLGIR